MVFYPRRISQQKRGSKRRRNGTIISKPRRSMRRARIPSVEALSVLVLCLLKALVDSSTRRDTTVRQTCVFPTRLVHTHPSEE